MHSRKKQVTRDEAKEKERLQKALKFSAASSKILQLKQNGSTDVNLLPTIAELLFVNPDFYTLWNYRREILVAFKETLDTDCSRVDDAVDEAQKKDNLKLEEFNRLCSNELAFIENCLKVNYKSYGTWHHRYWLVAFMNEPDLKREIQLCNQFLQMDERNFHGWNYRRYVVKLANVDPLEELGFSKDKINDNFSNFSSWYYRSSLLKALYTNGHDQAAIQSEIDQDYNQIQEAIYTDPTDQSIWLYLRWLFSVFSNGLQSLQSISSTDAGSSCQLKGFTWSSVSPTKYMAAFELSDYLVNQPEISITINKRAVRLTQWTATDGFLWHCLAGWEDAFEDGVEYTFEFKAPSLAYNWPSSLSFTHHQKSDPLVCFLYRVNSSRNAMTRVDSTKYQSLRELLDLEPDNKWLNFTLAWLESDDDAMNNIIDKLIQIDNLRENFYKDLRSKIVLAKFLSDQSNLCQLSLSLANLQLHSLRDVNRLVHIQHLDLSHNELIKLGVTFSGLVSLRCLILDSNSIYIVDDQLHLPNLAILSLASNRIGKWHPVGVILSNFPALKHLVLFDNPILLENRLNRAQLEDKVGERELKIYLERSHSEEVSCISNEIEAELKSIGSRQANVQIG